MSGIFDVDLKRLFKIILLNAVFIAVILYVVLQHSGNTEEYVETELVTLFEKRDVIEVEGYIFRNEIPIAAASKNISYLVENGEKLSKEQAVALLNTTAGDIERKLYDEDLNKKIDILESSNVNLDFITVDMGKINKDADNLYSNILKSIKGGKYKDSQSDRDDLLVLMNKKQIMTRERGSFDAEIEELKSRKSSITVSQSASGQNYVYTPKSGHFYVETDGYENIFTADAALNITFESYRELLEREPDMSIIENSLGKTAYDYEWFVVCEISLEDSGLYHENNMYDLIFPYMDRSSISFRLVKKVERVNLNSILLVFRTGEIPDNFDFSRKQTVNLVKNQVTGLRVPDSAIRIRLNDDNEKMFGVYVVKGDSIYFKQLHDNELIGKYDGYYLYSMPSKRETDSAAKLQINEEILLSGKDLYDGKVIR